VLVAARVPRVDRDGFSVAATDEAQRSAPIVMVASVIATLPLTLEVPAWQTVKPASLYDGSAPQMPAVSSMGNVFVVMRIFVKVRGEGGPAPELGAGQGDRRQVR